MQQWRLIEDQWICSFQPKFRALPRSLVPRFSSGTSLCCLFDPSDHDVLAPNAPPSVYRPNLLTRVANILPEFRISNTRYESKRKNER